MRKRLLISKVAELIEITNTLQRSLDSLKRENSELKDKIEILESQKAVLIEEAEASANETDNNLDANPENKVAEEIEPVKEAEVQEPSKEPETILDYAAKVIGTVVQESVKYANMITESSSVDKKELLNLIMGKAEITKAEIFSITEGEMAFELKKELIDTQCDEAVDYFKSAYGQITE